MNWSAYAPSLIALFGIPLAAFLALWRDERLREKQEKRDDLVATRQQEYWIVQKWWERKATAYTEIIEVLWQNINHTRAYLDVLYGERESMPQTDANEKAEWQRRQVNLRRTSDIGAFVVSDEVAEALQRYFTVVNQEIQEMEDPMDKLRQIYRLLNCVSKR